MRYISWRARTRVSRPCPVILRTNVMTDSPLPSAGTAGARPTLSLTQWLIIIIASIGFLFDTYELLMTPLAAPPAIAELLKVPLNHPAVTAWTGRLLWITALCGGIF